MLSRMLTGEAAVSQQVLRIARRMPLSSYLIALVVPIPREVKG